MDVALRRHLSVLDPSTDWSGFCFRPRVGTVLDEGYAGVTAFKAPEGSGQLSVGCQMNSPIDLGWRAKLIGGRVGLQFQRLVADIFLTAVLPEAFAVGYIRLLGRLKTAGRDVQQHRDVPFYTWHFGCGRQGVGEWLLLSKPTGQSSNLLRSCMLKHSPLAGRDWG